jgi:hypothetical protein
LARTLPEASTLPRVNRKATQRLMARGDIR